MPLKFKINNASSKIVHESAITFVNEETAIYNFLVSMNLENDFLKVSSGESFTNLVSLEKNLEVLKQIKFGDLHNTIKCGMLHLKVVVR